MKENVYSVYVKKGDENVKGNLSKKKGFLGELEQTDLESISDILEVKYGERLDEAETDIGELQVAKESTANKTDEISGTEEERRTKYTSAEAVFRYGNKIKQEANTYTDDMFDKAAGQIEDVDKKASNNAEEIGEIWNDMGTMTEAFENRIVGVEGRVAEAESGLTEKEDVSNKINSLNMGGFYDDNQYPTAQAVCGFVDEEKANTINTIIDNYYNKNTLDEKIEAKEDVSNKIITEDEVSETAPYFSVEATKAYVTEAIRVMKDSLIKYISEQLANFEGGGSDYVAYAETKVENGVLSLFENSSLGSVLSASIIGDVLSITQARNIYTTNIENNVLTFA